MRVQYGNLSGGSESARLIQPAPGRPPAFLMLLVVMLASLMCFFHARSAGAESNSISNADTTVVAVMNASQVVIDPQGVAAPQGILLSYFAEASFIQGQTLVYLVPGLVQQGSYEVEVASPKQPAEVICSVPFLRSQVPGKMVSLLCPWQAKNVPAGGIRFAVFEVSVGVRRQLASVVLPSAAPVNNVDLNWQPRPISSPLTF